jgi:hypothetical protein
MSKYEKLIEYIVNEQDEKARELFHQLVVERSRRIYESLIDEEDLEEIGGDQVEGLVDEITSDEEGMLEAEDEEDADTDADTEMDMDDAEDDMDDAEMDMDDAEMDMDMDMDDAEDGMDDHHSDMGGNEELEDRVVDLEDALDALRDEFEGLMGADEGDMGGDEEDGMTPEMDGGEMPAMEAPEAEMMTEEDADAMMMNRL